MVDPAAFGRESGYLVASPEVDSVRAGLGSRVLVPRVDSFGREPLAGCSGDRDLLVRRVAMPNLPVKGLERGAFVLAPGALSVIGLLARTPLPRKAAREACGVIFDCGRSMICRGTVGRRR